MDTTVKPSFIPKRPLSVIDARPRRGLNIFALIAFILFFAALVLAIGVFVWRVSIEREITDLQTALENAKEALDPKIISELTTLSTHMQGVSQVLDNHRAASEFFDYLETITMKNVQFRNFNFTVGKNNQFQVSMDGQAGSFATVALQSDVFLANSLYLKQPTISNVSAGENGAVSFRVNAMVDSNLISYRARLEKQAAGLQPPPQAMATSTASSTPN